MTNPTAFAAPVDDGMMLADAALPALQSLPPFDGPSTTNYVAVEACTVVMRPMINYWFLYLQQFQSYHLQL